VNYLHYGAPKRWYAIPPHARGRFETLMRGLLPDLFRRCPEFMRHKELVVSPALLEAHAIPVVRATQHAGEFMINLPGERGRGRQDVFFSLFVVVILTPALPPHPPLRRLPRRLQLRVQLRRVDKLCDPGLDPRRRGRARVHLLARLGHHPHGHVSSVRGPGGAQGHP
jgi:hypothetical protein